MTGPLTLHGDIWLGPDESSGVGDMRISLLERIDRTGSITQAARAAGISYKTAWDTVDAMKNLAAEPLVESETGGARGGGTRLTEAGRKLVETYRLIQREHERFLATLSTGMDDFPNFYRLIRRLSMKTSARNQFFGTVAHIESGPISSEIQVALNGEDRIVAVITRESQENLGLNVGSEVWALVKASWVILTAGDGPLMLSARNRLCGTVLRIARGEVNSDVVLTLSGGNTICAIVTNDGVRQMKLKEGASACAVFNASSVILGIAV